MNREQKLQVIRRWIEYVGLTEEELIEEDTLDADAISLDDLDDCDLDYLIEQSQEDRARLVAEGCFIREDWTEAV